MRDCQQLVAKLLYLRIGGLCIGTICYAYLEPLIVKSRLYAEPLYAKELSVCSLHMERKLQHTVIQTVVAACLLRSSSHLVVFASRIPSCSPTAPHSYENFFFQSLFLCAGGAESPGT